MGNMYGRRDDLGDTTVDRAVDEAMSHRGEGLVASTRRDPYSARERGGYSSLQSSGYGYQHSGYGYQHSSGYGREERNERRSPRGNRNETRRVTWASSSSYHA